MVEEISLEELIEKYAVKNAIDYGGKANIKSVLGKVLMERPDLRENVDYVRNKVVEICNEINALSIEEQKEIMEKYEYEERVKERKFELPHAEKGRVVMRLAPFPSGPLHIGHARMAILNDEFVKKYGGKLLLVFDDTAGSKEKRVMKEAYNMILDDLKYLGVDVHEIHYKSDRMEIYYKYAEKFLRNGWAYVCLCSQNELREKRRRGEICEHRNHSVDENLDLWRKMIEGEFNEGDAVVRLKTDMKHKDPAFRDRVILRISEEEHPRTGKKYRVWPMLEFSWAIDDHLLGITHILRGRDLVMEDRMEMFMWDLMKWKKPVIVHYGLLQLEGIKVSTSLSKKKIENKEYIGWHDPRTYSLISLKKRGISSEAIRRFILSLWLSENDIKVPVENLYKENRVIIDSKANRYFFIANPVRYEVENLKERVVKLPKHVEFPERGERHLYFRGKVYIDVNDEKLRVFRLKGLGNFKIEDNKLIFIDNSLKTAREKNLKVIHWLPEGIEAKIMMNDGKIIKGLCEDHILMEKEGNVVQFERFGFCRIENMEDLLLYFGHG